MAPHPSTLARAFAPALAVTLLALPAAWAESPPAFRPPVPLVRSLPNGLRVAVFPSHRLPIVQIQLVIPAGATDEPADAPGVAEATARLLRAGTTSRAPAAFAADLERLGGTLTCAASRDFSIVSGSFLAAGFEQGLELLSDATVNPVFPPEEVARYRAQTGALLLQMRQNPAALADEQLWARVFEGHPYGRQVPGTVESIERIDRQAVRAFHRDHYRPDRAVLAIAGDVDPERAFAAAVDRFGHWAGRSSESPIPAPPNRPTSTRVLVVDRPGQATCEVRVGLVCPPRTDPDAPALQLANHVLGGAGMSSRLAEALRVDGGLAYGVHSSYTSLRTVGLLSIGSSARGDSVGVLVERMRDALAGMTARPPSEAEVSAARRTFVNGYPLQFQTLGALIGQWIGADLYGLPPDWLGRAADDVAAVTREQVVEAARRWLDPARMVVVVVGPASTIRPRLESMGTVEVVNPEAPAPSPLVLDLDRSDPERIRRGRELVNRVLVAHGGLERMRRVKESVVNGEMIIQLGGNEVPVQSEQLRKDPFRMRNVTRMVEAENGQILNGSRGWLYATVVQNTTVTEADSEAVATMRMAFRSDIVHTLLALADTATRVVSRGPGRVAGGDVEVLDVALPPVTAGARPEHRLLYLDAKSHRLVAEDTGERVARPGSFEVRRLYRDHRVVEGVLWPFSEERLRDGTSTMSLTVKGVRLNPDLPDAAFEAPGSGRETRRR